MSHTVLDVIALIVSALCGATLIGILVENNKYGMAAGLAVISVTLPLVRIVQLLAIMSRP
jgi:hypothetical protein